MNTHIYIAACDENGGIYHYTQNNDGSLNKIEFFPLDRPMYLTISDGRMYVILREPFENSTDSGVFSYEITNDGALKNPSEIISTRGKVACHLYVAPGDTNPYCVNYLSGSVIKTPDKLVTHIGEGPSKPRQDMSHTHFVSASPDNKYILVTDLGLDTIFTYDRSLSENSRAKVPQGHGVRHLAFSEDGKTVFAANELESTLSAFDYNDGVLTLKDTLSALPCDFEGKSTIAAIRVRCGKIFVSNRGHDSISCFDYKNGKLTLLYVTKVGGSSPRDFDFIGDYVYSTNETTNNTTVLKFNGEALELTKFEYPAPNPLCVVGIEL